MILKFRAWHKENKEMIEVGEMDFNLQSIYYGMGNISFDDFVIMQYTGHKDRNGTEIAMDDLVADEYNRIYRVAFAGDCWRCEPIKRSYSKNRWISTDLEVIGNIHEDPEVIEQ